MFGRLGFALNSVQGRFGRAMLKPIKRRQYELRRNMNPQLLASLCWFRKFLWSHTPRAVPVCLGSQKVVVSYSDGEGSGGVGVAVWHPELPRPVAAFINVPYLLRTLWALQANKTFTDGETKDIFEIEAIGSILALETWPDLFRDMLWAHYIDNAAAQASLARGSSSVESGEVIVSMTWQRVVRLRALPWFDRVASKSNPVDGLSRNDFSGPWERVEKAVLPRGIFPRIRDELKRRGIPTSVDASRG